MSTFLDSQARTGICQRIERLTPQAQRQWGKMTSHQMVCHLNDAFRMVSGEGTAPRSASNPFTRTFVRWVALHTSLPWPHGIKTVPEADQMIGGTPPTEWDRDRGALVGYVTAFGSGRNGKPGLAEPHPIFGPLSEPEWMIWAYRHCDHHLRQFGL
jgi:hypothetical protein